MIKQLCKTKKWKPLKLSMRDPYISHLFFTDDLILFAEASLKQVELIRKVMELFCKASSHHMNLNKTKLFCSINVCHQRVSQLSQYLGVCFTPNLGKYLGAPLLHQRITKGLFNPLIRKVQQRLSSWKSSFLSITGRMLLIKSIISYLPSYLMQTLLLPKGILSKIGKSSRRFLWTNREDHKKLHLISWNKVKLHKTSGGLGIKDLQIQNITFIMKLCWGLLTKPESL